MVAELENLVKTAEFAASALSQMTEQATKEGTFTVEMANSLVQQVDVGVTDVNNKINAGRQYLQDRMGPKYKII